MTVPHDFGRHCEELAAAHLAATGWQIVQRNYRFGHREIDVIARRGDLIIFVEVKGRRGPAWGHPLDAITARKRQEIQQVARHWLVRFGAARQSYRFDAIAVLAQGDRTRITHIEGAWRM